MDQIIVRDSCRFSENSNIPRYAFGLFGKANEVYILQVINIRFGGLLEWMLLFE